MGKIIITCLVVAGLFAAAVEMPNTLAHEGHGNHDGHDHGPIEQPKKGEPTDSNAVITSPPPFETLNNGSSSRTPAQPRPEKVAPDREQSPYADRDFTFNDGPPSTLTENQLGRNSFSTTPRQFGRDLRGPSNQTEETRDSYIQRNTLPRFNRSTNEFIPNGCWKESSCPYQSSGSHLNSRWIGEMIPNRTPNRYDCPNSSNHCFDSGMHLFPNECFDELNNCLTREY